MQQQSDRLEPKRMNKLRILRFISYRGAVSKAAISSSLKISMPTTLQNVKELVESGLVVEEGEYESTGGRKAKALSIARDAGYSVGADITNHHLCLVVVNTRKEMIRSARLRIPFENTPEYYERVGREIEGILEEAGVGRRAVIGVGFSLPGIVDKQQKLLIRSHTLQLQNVSFRNMGNYIPYDYGLENDANSAAYAELAQDQAHAIYLSLSNTVGGAIYLQDHLYEGENFKSAEFGHMIIERNGRPCYCGKKGCMDAYCTARLLQDQGNGSLEAFFERVRSKDPAVMGLWDEYLDALAVSVSNLRMAFDCDIVLGGYVGGYLGEFMPELEKKVRLYNNFDLDTSYLRTGRYKLLASAYGVTLGFINAFLERTI